MDCPRASLFFLSKERPGSRLSFSNVDYNIDFMKDIDFPCEIDEISQKIFPPDVASLDLVPLSCSADSNCLFNAVSILICGNESLSVELFACS